MPCERPSLSDADPHKLFPLTVAQRDVWFGQMLDTKSACFNVSGYLEILGSIDVVLFEKALRKAVGEIRSLHAVISDEKEGLGQFFRPFENFAIPFMDVSRTDDPRAAALAWMYEDTKQAFDLVRGGPLFRYALFKIADGVFFCYGAYHHLIVDAFCASLIDKRVAEHYREAAEGCSAAELFSVLDLLDEEGIYRASAQRERDQLYWRTQCAGLPDAVTLSGLPPRWPEALIASECSILPSIVQKLNALGAASRVSLAAVVAAIAAVYISIKTGSCDIVLGMPVAARTNAKMRRSIGLAVNVVPLRLSVDLNAPFQDLLEHSGRSLRAALRHQRYWASALRQDLGLNSKQPNVYGTLINFIPADEGIDFAGLPVRKHYFANSPIEDLSIFFYLGREDAEASLIFKANRANYDAQTLDKHREDFFYLIEAIAANPDQAMDQFRLSNLVQPHRASHKEAGSKTVPDIATQYGEPVTTEEIILCDCVAELLGLESVALSDDFFELGGHSLMANRLANRIRTCLGRELPIKTIFDKPVLGDLARALAVSSGPADESVPVLQNQNAGQGYIPLSYSQERMWLIQSINPQTTAYNIVFGVQIQGVLDIEAMSKAVDELSLRHEVLRCTIRSVDDVPFQDIQPWAGHVMSFTDLQGRGDQAMAVALQQAKAEAQTPFDLSRGPVIRVKLFQTAHDDYLLVVNFHHIVADQWSIGIIARELAGLYNGLRRGKPARLDPLPIAYKDYALWQRKSDFEPEFERQITYWCKQLAELHPLELPTDRARPQLPSLNGTFCEIPIPSHLLQTLERLGHRSSSTLFMIMLAAFAALLHRISGQDDITIGVPIANRSHSLTEGLIGTFVNTLVMRMDLSGNPEFSEFLARVRATALDAFAHADVPFERLVQKLGQRRDSNHAPLTQVLFNVANVPMNDIAFDGVEWKPVLLDRGGAQFELSLSVDPQISRSMIIEYNTDLFDRSTAERLGAQYFAILECAAAAPCTRLHALTLLSQDQLAVLRGWNETSEPFPDEVFSRIFEDQAVLSVNSPAFSYAGDTMTYGELNARANAVARGLRELGAGPGVLVALCVNRSSLLMIALLGIHKSGGAYVPLDPDFPAERLEFMLSDCGAKVLITAGAAASKLSLPADIRVFDLDAKAEYLAKMSTENLAECAKPDDAAYLIYTSGSTGRPKGVAVQHKALLNFLWSMRRRLDLKAADVFAAVTTISFDIAALELYLPLLSGARIELVPREIAIDGRELARLLDSRGASVLQATPAMWRMLLEADWKGRKEFCALSGGEPLPRDLANAILDRASVLWNLYGPTETTVWSTAGQVEPGTSAISIGPPIGNTQIHILDFAGGVLPVGSVGEICIGGAGVALGYHERASLTAERFIADGFSGEAGARLYRTGDLGHWGPDGKLYHLGRSDNQVKIRGYRIELGEIETVLRSHTSIKDASVVAVQAEHEDQRLVAYVIYTKNEDMTVSELRQYLRRQLPDFMIPSIIMVIDSMPMTPNGKLDRNALPNPFNKAARATPDHDSPSQGMEQLIADIWQSVLKLDRVGTRDNFFELGGHSLLSMRVAAEVEKRTGFRMDPRILFFNDLRQVAAQVASELNAVGKDHS